MEDLYKILGVEKTASQDEIKKAFRKMAMKYHPDKNPGDKVAEENFKKLNAAYSVLGDEDKRRQYDMYGSQSFSSGSSSGPGETTGDPYEDFFNDFFGHNGGDFRRYTYTYTNPEHDRNPENPISIITLMLNVAQVVFCGMGLLIIGPYALVFRLLFLYGFVRGIQKTYKTLKHLLK